MDDTVDWVTDANGRLLQPHAREASEEEVNALMECFGRGNDLR